eukprot:2399417-Prymnesium_polylepis.1
MRACAARVFAAGCDASKPSGRYAATCCSRPATSRTTMQRAPPALSLSMRAVCAGVTRPLGVLISM